MQHLSYVKNMFLLVLGFSTLSAYSRVSEIKPSFGYTKSGDKILFLACVNRTHQCEQYKFFLKKGSSQPKAITGSISKEILTFLKTASKRGKLNISKYSSPSPENLFLSTFYFGQELIGGLAGFSVIILTGPLDIALFPVTSLGFGMVALQRAVKNYRLKKALQRMLGLRHLRRTCLSKESFDHLVWTLKNLERTTPLPKPNHMISKYFSLFFKKSSGFYPESR